MNNLLNQLPHSKAPKYCSIIRESIEISREELFEVSADEGLDGEDEDCFDEVSQEDYESLKNDVLRMLKQRLDEK